MFGLFRYQVGTTKLKCIAPAGTRKIVIRANYDAWQAILLCIRVALLWKRIESPVVYISYSNVSISSNCCKYEAINSTYKSYTTSRFMALRDLNLVSRSHASKGEAILRACEPEPRAASRESLFASLKRSKNGHNALIWYLLHVGLLLYAKL